MQITINIPTDKEAWVLAGWSVRHGSKENMKDFVKETLINFIREEALRGHNEESGRVNETEAGTVILS